eukprot:6190234-Pleurochrysis_carterae.AAC.1
MKGEQQHSEMLVSPLLAFETNQSRKSADSKLGMSRVSSRTVTARERRKTPPPQESKRLGLHEQTILFVPRAIGCRNEGAMSDEGICLLELAAPEASELLNPPFSGNCHLCTQTEAHRHLP